MDFKKWYDSRAKSYENNDKQGLLRYRLAIEFASITKNMEILDIGCKSLNLLNLLEDNKIKCNYTGIDISKVALEKSRFKVNNNPQIILRDVMEGIPLEDNSIDRIYCLEVIEHVHTPIFLLEEITRILKKDGLAVVSCPNPYYWVNILNSFSKQREHEGHISSFSYQNIQTLCDFVGLQIIKTKKTFMSFPPIKHCRRVYIKSSFGIFSESIQYCLSKK